MKKTGEKTSTLFALSRIWYLWWNRMYFLGICTLHDDTWRSLCSRVRSYLHRRPHKLSLEDLSTCLVVCHLKNLVKLWDFIHTHNWRPRFYFRFGKKVHTLLYLLLSLILYLCVCVYEHYIFLLQTFTYVQIIRIKSNTNIGTYRILVHTYLVLWTKIKLWSHKKCLTLNCLDYVCLS